LVSVARRIALAVWLALLRRSGKLPKAIGERDGGLLTAARP
jgi:hypothetical protein